MKRPPEQQPTAATKDLLAYKGGPQFRQEHITEKVSRVNERARTPLALRNREVQDAEYRNTRVLFRG